MNNEIEWVVPKISSASFVKSTRWRYPSIRLGTCEPRIRLGDSWASSHWRRQLKELVVTLGAPTNYFCLGKATASGLCSSAMNVSDIGRVLISLYSATTCSRRLYATRWIVHNPQRWHTIVVSMMHDLRQQMIQTSHEHLCWNHRADRRRPCNTLELSMKTLHYQHHHQRQLHRHCSLPPRTLHPRLKFQLLAHTVEIGRLIPFSTTFLRLMLHASHSLLQINRAQLEARSLRPLLGEPPCCWP